MPFPTFSDLTQPYVPPSEAKKKLFADAREAVALLGEQLFSSDGGFVSDAEAISTFREKVGAMLPVAHPDATACSRVCDDVRMYSTRRRGGALVRGRGPADYDLFLDWALAQLDIALARAIFSQP